jgi:general stress protein 26
MRQVEVSYDELEQEFIKELSKLGSEGLYQRGVLATSHDGYVTARRMRLIPDGLNVYCWTTRHARKHKQILANPNVALVVGFIQIEGVASVKGHPMDEDEFLELYKTSLPEAYESSIRDWRDFDQVVIKVTPKRLALYDAIGRADVSHLDVLNVVNGEAHRIYEFDQVQEDHSDAPSYSE